MPTRTTVIAAAMLVMGFIPANGYSTVGGHNPGQKLYDELCATCHGKDKRGGVGPNLTTSNFRYGKSRAALHTSILRGRPGGMPGFSAHLDRAQLDALVTFILSRP